MAICSSNHSLDLYLSKSVLPKFQSSHKHGFFSKSVPKKKSSSYMLKDTGGVEVVGGGGGGGKGGTW